MFLGYSLLFMLGAYLLANVNLALIISRKVSGMDIRKEGTGAAGTANIARFIGKKWAALVFFFDFSKSFVVLVVSRAWLYAEHSFINTTLLVCIALCAVLGHCRPLLHNFKGGGGIATTMGAFCFFVPMEFFLSLMGALGMSELFFRNAQYRYGQWIPILFLILTPIITFVASLTFDIKVTETIHFGGKPWYMALFMLLFSLMVCALNTSIARQKFHELRKL